MINGSSRKVGGKKQNIYIYIYVYVYVYGVLTFAKLNVHFTKCLHHFCCLVKLCVGHAPDPADRASLAHAAGVRMTGLLCNCATMRKGLEVKNRVLTCH